MRLRIERDGTRALLSFECLQNAILPCFFTDDRHIPFPVRTEGETKRSIERDGIDAFADWQNRFDLAALRVHYNQLLICTAAEECAGFRIDRKPTWAFARRDRP